MPTTRRGRWLHREPGGLLLALAMSACSGQIGGPGGPWADGSGGEEGAQPGSGGGGSVGESSAALGCEPGTVDPGPSPLRLLTREEYLNTLRDLFGSAADLEGVLDPVPPPSGFGLVAPDVSQVELEGFQRAAERAAAGVVSDTAWLGRFAPCDGAPRACARAFVESFALRAYRAPITDEADLARHLALYDLGAAEGHTHGLELVLRGMLQSPRFLYKVELGTDERVSDTAVRLSDYELAARLSYAFWRTLPDDSLLAEAQAGRLHEPAQLSAQLVRMLDDPRGQPALREFLARLAHVDQLALLVKDPAVYPEWQEQGLATALGAQARAFFAQVLAEGGSLRTLLTSTRVPVGRSVAALYGLGDAPEDFTSVERADDHTAGLLSLPAFLAVQAKPDESSPIYRGKFVREALLCEHLPAPPPDVPPAPEVAPGLSTRERMNQHQVDPACSGCHQRLDPLGFGFEAFDGIGRYRTTDMGQPVDDRGELLGTRDADGPFRGVVELGERLAESAAVQDCMARQWFRYALGRTEQGADACSVEQLRSAFSASGARFDVLPSTLLRSPAFLYRRPIEEDSP